MKVLGLNLANVLPKHNNNRILKKKRKKEFLRFVQIPNKKIFFLTRDGRREGGSAELFGEITR